ncbi:uncharacterized protein L203_105963 [Cryptococcus depauperatus CBS 7841]|uniref:Uncharacterized protein n=1 Tax=Cryptococcus depauperatus CBS 7841 TaxID=1295531 RepID=A0A1E3IVC8_9TREE|nr:hypothetical protein L204_06219 [Cryptococcus depauperatus CBS 7855]ODN92395.1 hypothetical protein L203_00671 [Cryptococcus depauperatus CBS 7841]
MVASDSQPLLPTHVNHSSKSRFSVPRISFPSHQSSGSIKSADSWSSESTLRPLRPLHQVGTGNDGAMGGFQDKREGVAKITRECLWSEIKCYGSYMLPPLLVFGVLVVLVSLAAVGWKMGWYS